MSNAIDLEGEIYSFLRMVPKGKVVTYGQVAEYLGNRGLARVVGNVLHKNGDERNRPCYKVVNWRGDLAEHFVFGGREGQRLRLEAEGIKVEDGRVDLGIYGFEFK